MLYETKALSRPFPQVLGNIDEYSLSVKDPCR